VYELWLAVLVLLTIGVLFAGVKWGLTLRTAWRNRDAAAMGRADRYGVPALVGLFVLVLAAWALHLLLTDGLWT
jgi:hypothetical protein